MASLGEIAGMIENKLQSEPSLMDCPECTYKHFEDLVHDVKEGRVKDAVDDLRDAEHHMEDAVRVKTGSEREKYNTMIDTVRNFRKQLFDIIVDREFEARGGKDKPTGKKKTGCTTCALAKLPSQEVKCEGADCDLKKGQQGTHLRQSARKLAIKLVN